MHFPDDPTGFLLPTLASASLGYAVVHLEDHAATLSVQVDVPVVGTEQPSVGVGLEYAFADMLFVRGGYTFNSLQRSFSAGLGLKLALGFTQYVVDYTFRPIPDYGFVHSVGVSVRF